MTERTRMHFVVKATEKGAPWIALEPFVENLSILDRGFLGFDLPPGTSGTEAERIAVLLSESIVAVTYTEVPGFRPRRAIRPRGG